MVFAVNDDSAYAEGNSSTTEFEFYEPTVEDPGWMFTVGVIGFCLGLNAMLPLSFCLQRRYGWCQYGKQASEESHDDDADHDDKSRSSRASAPSSVVSFALSQVVISTLDGVELQRRHHRLKHRHRINHFEDTPAVPTTVTAKYASHEGKGDAASVVLPEDAVSCQHEKQSPEEDELRPQTYWELLLEVADLDQNTRKVWSLFWPYSCQSILSGIFDIVDTAIVGYYLGVKEQNVVIIVSTLKSFTKTLRYGFKSAFGTLAPQAKGAGNDLLVGRYLQMCMILYSIANLPGIIIWFFYTEEAVLWFGFDAETAALAQRMVYPGLVASIFAGIDSLLWAFVDNMGYEKYGIFLEFLYYGVDTLILVLVVVVGGSQDLFLLRLWQNVVGLFLMCGNVGFIIYRGWLDPYWEGFAKSNSFKDPRALRTVMITAIPMSLGYILTYGESEFLYIFIRSLGPAELAAWGLIGDIWDLFEDIVSEISGATEVRVGHYMGAGDIVTARMLGYKGIYLSTIMSLVATAGLFIFAEDVPKILTPDPTLRKMIFDTLPMIGVGQLLMCMTNVCWSIMEATGRTRLVTVIEVITSWGLMVPLVALVIFYFNYNLVGVVGALIIGYTASNVVIAFLTFTSDWKYLSDLVISRNGKQDNNKAGKEGSSPYDSYNWDDLPDEIQLAASVLGYSKDIWDSSKRSPCDSKMWSELTTNQKEAALKMGYSANSWDTDNSSNSSSSSSSSSSNN